MRECKEFQVKVQIDMAGAESDPPPSKVPFKANLKGPSPGGSTKMRRA